MYLINPQSLESFRKDLNKYLLIIDGIERCKKGNNDCYYQLLHSQFCGSLFPEIPKRLKINNDATSKLLQKNKLAYSLTLFGPLLLEKFLICQTFLSFVAV